MIQSDSFDLDYSGLCSCNPVFSFPENTLKDSVVLDISGCTVEEILFYVSKGSPVFAMTGTDSAVLVTGYTSGSIYYYDPQTHSTRSKGYKDADDWFRKAGYIFFTYLDR